MALAADGGSSFILLRILVSTLTPGSLLSAILGLALLGQSLPLLNLLNLRVPPRLQMGQG